MPNYCYTTITIIHKDERKLKDFYEKVGGWAKKTYSKNGFDCPEIGYYWLGNIVGNSGLAKWTKKENGTEDFVPNISCRGTLQSLELRDNQISISTETAWCPMLEMWQLLCEKHLKGAEIYYVADQDGDGMYQTNDPDVIGKYNIDIVDTVPDEFEDFAESNYEATQEVVVELLQRVLRTLETDMDKLLRKLDVSDESEWLHIHPWKTVELNEVIDCE